MDKPNSGGKAATNVDITGILGPIESDKLLEILALHPTVSEVEEAAMWLSGDPDVFGKIFADPGKFRKIGFRRQHASNALWQAFDRARGTTIGTDPKLVFPFYFE